MTVAGATDTVPTGGFVTVSEVEPGTFSTVAVIVAVPAPTAVTTPLDTVATPVLELAQTGVCPEITVPDASCAATTSVCLSPVTMASGFGVTKTFDTAPGATVICEDPLFPSDVAVMSAVPLSFAVTSPVPSTVATLGLFDVQIMPRSCSTFWPAS